VICYDQARCLTWARQISGKPLAHEGWWTAIGHEVGGQLVAVVFYTQPDSSEDIALHVIAKPGEPWLTSSFAASVFAYPFSQLLVQRVSAAAAAADSAFQRMLEKLGFTREGIKRRLIGGRDFVMFGMLREECRYVR
jgi:RimJ/RimL family protein N-acetyltransferase